jgi:glucokinase
MPTLFVVVSGLPGSGKTTLARQLATALDLPLIDKDDILEQLFERKGTGDAVWRRTLSRESDDILQREAEKSDGAVLSSFWRLPGMSPDSGTPSDWLHAPSNRLVNVRCLCEPTLAATRFIQRQRHPGHLDRRSSYADVLAQLQQLATLGPLDIDRRVDVDTSGELALEDVVSAIRAALV